MLLSVVLVVRKHQAWVRPCLRSILDQAPDDLDVVVVDDASTDHTARIVAEVSDGDPRVRVHRSDTRMGTPPPSQPVATWRGATTSGSSTPPT